MKPNTVFYNLNIILTIAILFSVIILASVAIKHSGIDTDTEKNTVSVTKQETVVFDNLGYRYREVYIKGHKYYGSSSTLTHAGDCECNIRTNEINSSSSERLSNK